MNRRRVPSSPVEAAKKKGWVLNEFLNQLCKLHIYLYKMRIFYILNTTFLSFKKSYGESDLFLHKVCTQSSVKSHVFKLKTDLTSWFWMALILYLFINKAIIMKMFYLFFFLALLGGLWDLNFSTRDWTCAPTVKTA